ncbi:hypothetical protein FS819_023040 [Allorhizobium sp. Av2]|nr:hypothetical protein [Allorhizobium sp. Av2]
MPISDFKNLSDAQGSVLELSPYDSGPSFGQTVGAGVRQSNSLVSYISALPDGVDENFYKPNPEYNPYHDPDLTEYVQKHPAAFTEAYNKQMGDAVRQQIDQENEDRKTLSAGGIVPGLLGGIIGGLTDPAALAASMALGPFAPAATAGRAARVGFMAGDAALSTVANEAALQTVQQTRTMEESGANIIGAGLLGGAIGGSTILAGMLGRAGDHMGSWLSNDEISAASRAFDDAMRVGDGEDALISGARSMDRPLDTVDGARLDAQGRPIDDMAARAGDDLEPGAVRPDNGETFLGGKGSVGAAAADAAMTREDLGMARQGFFGWLGGKIMDATAPLSPNLRLMNSPSQVVRETAAMMLDNPIYTAANMEGRTLGTNAESGTRYYMGQAASWQKEFEELYQDFRKAGGRLTKDEFGERVSKAARRGDADPAGVPQITKAAESLRERLYDPMLIEMKQLEMLPPDVKTTTAASYVTRYWDKAKLMADAPRVKQIFQNYFQGVVAAQKARSEEIKLGRKVVQAMDVDEKYGKASERLANYEDRLSSRQKVRDGKLNAIKEIEARRYGSGAPSDKPAKGVAGVDERQDAFLQDRAAQRQRKLDGLRKLEDERYKELYSRADDTVVEALKSAADDDTFMDFVRHARRNVEKDFPSNPVIDILKTRGGVRRGSMLAHELAKMDINPKAYPGLFTKEGGIGAVDNLVGSEFPVLANLPKDANGYVDQQAILDALREEAAGRPLRSSEQLAAIDKNSIAQENLVDWLEGVGLSPDTRIKDIRARINDVTGRERRLLALDERISKAETDLSAHDIETSKKQKELLKTRDQVDDAEIERLDKLIADLERFDTMTDGIRNEHMIAKAEASNILEQLRALEDEISGNEANLGQVQASPRIKQMVDFANARKEYRDARYNITRVESRLDALKRLEKQSPLPPELDAEFPKLESDLRKFREREEKAKVKTERLKKLMPKQSEELPEFMDEQDEADYVNDIVESVFGKLTGLDPEGALAEVPDWIVPAKAGPLKERTFNIPDNLVEPYLENDPRKIVEKYSRVVGAEIELTKRFGRADLKDQITRLVQDYNGLIDKAKTQKERLDLAERMNKDKADLMAMRDILRGQYSKHSGAGWATEAARTLTAFNFATKMGSLALNSFQDVGGILGKNGLRRTMADSTAMFASALKRDGYASMTKAEAREMGVAVESIMEAQMMSRAELVDPLRPGNPFTRAVENSARFVAKYSFGAQVSDWMRTMAYRVNSNRLQKAIADAVQDVEIAGRSQRVADFGRLKPDDRTLLAHLGINEDGAMRIAAMLRQHAVDDGSLRISNAMNWEDVQARKAWSAAMNKFVDQTVMSRAGIGDTPLFMRSNWGRVMLQFKSFIMAAHSRVLLNGLQQNQHRLLEHLVGVGALGMLSVYLAALARGDMDGAQKMLDNPGKWISNGIDRSGVFALLMDTSNTASKVAQEWGGNIPGLPDALGAALGDKDAGGPTYRYTSRNWVGALAGPSVQTIQDLGMLGVGLAKRDMQKSDAGRIMRNLPGATLPGIRFGTNGILRPALEREFQN